MWPERAIELSPFGALSQAHTLGEDGDRRTVAFPTSLLPCQETMTLRVLVVDDHPAFRRALTSALNRVKDIEVAGEAGGGTEAATRAVEGDHDLVLMDLSMPDLDGIEAMRRIHEQRPGLPVVILTAHADPGVEKEAREAGASGFLAKGTALEQLLAVLHEAAPEAG
jgi:DNA-binding NarL/FixJ family response regulator